MLSSQAAARALRTPAAARALAGASRRLHSAPCALKDGEDVAREHLGAENEPQIQKQTSEQGADETAGGAYASRDSPRAQASQPVGGMSEKQIVQEQGAGQTISPQTAGTGTEGGKDMRHPSAPAPPAYAGEGAAEDAADEAEEQAMGRDLQKAEGWDPWAQ